MHDQLKQLCQPDIYGMTETEKLQEFLLNDANMTPEAAGAFADRFRLVSFPRRTVLTAIGNTERFLYFPVSGVQRICGQHNDKIHTLVFTYPGSFSGVADSFLQQRPSKWMLETLTASQMLRAGHEAVMQCVSRFPPLQQFLYSGLGGAIQGILERQFELMAFTAEEKLQTLFRRSPHIFQLIPHKYIASYIGVDATTFSKMLRYLP